ncbi:MAG: hypothetical protein ABIG96_00855 [Candidatus Micrarchaeota archaeon]
MNLKAQASFFDGIMFMLLVIFSISLIFISFNSYSVAQDKVLRTAYLSNYLQSTAKALYYIDASSLSEVKSYCNDRELSAAPGVIGTYYCKPQYALDCSGLGRYKGQISVADLVKKDLDPSDTGGVRGAFDDKFGSSDQMGRTALRCAMKEIMKPFTFSGYRYLTEVAEAITAGDNVIYAKDKKYSSDFMFSPRFANLPAVAQDEFDCGSVSGEASIASDQLLVIRTPFRILTKKSINIGGTDAGTFESKNYVLRTCLWPSKDVLR